MAEIEEHLSSVRGIIGVYPREARYLFAALQGIGLEYAVSNRDDCHVHGYAISPRSMVSRSRQTHGHRRKARDPQGIPELHRCPFLLWNFSIRLNFHFFRGTDDHIMLGE